MLPRYLFAVVLFVVVIPLVCNNDITHHAANCRNSENAIQYQRRSIVVRTLVSAGELSLSCARLLAG